MWDSGFLIEVYSRQCQALARSVKMNEKSEREAKEARKQRKRECAKNGGKGGGGSL